MIKYAKCFSCKYNADNTCLKHESDTRKCEQYDESDAMMDLQKSLP